MAKVGILYDNISGNTGDVAIGLSIKKILREIDVEFDELFPGNFNPSDYDTIIIGGGHLIRPSPDFFYDKFKVPGQHVLNAIGVLDSPQDLHYLEDYKYLTVRSSWDREKLSYLKKEVHVVPCTTMLLEDQEDLPLTIEGPSLGIHLLPQMFNEEQEAQFVEWICALPFKVYLIPITHYNQDYIYLNHLSTRIKNSILLPIMKPLEIFTLIGKFDYFIGCSLHGGIFAYRHNVPFVLFDYNEKMRFFMKDRGLEQFTFTNLNEMMASFDHLLKDTPDYSQKISQDQEILRKHVQHLKEILPSGSPNKTKVDYKAAQANYQIQNLLSQSIRSHSQLSTYEADISNLANQLQEAKSRALALEQANAQREAQIAAISSQLQEANSQVQTQELAKTGHEAQIASLSSQLLEATGQVQTLEQAKVGHEAQIASLSSQLHEANSQVQTLEQAKAEHEAQIASLGNQLQEANSQVQTLEQANAKHRDAIEHIHILEGELQDMRQSIIWQLLMKFHSNVIEQVLPCGTGRRRNYDMLLKGSRILINDGYGVFLPKASEFIYRQYPFLKPSSNAPVLDVNILSYPSTKVPLSLDEDLRIKFTFPVAELSEIKVLTATYNRRNSDILLSIMESINGPPIRTCRVKGRNIRDNDYTSFKFKPIKDSANKTFFVRLRSDGEPSAAVWFSSEIDRPEIQLYKSEEKIKGCIGFESSSRLKVKDSYDLWIMKNEPNGSNWEDLKKESSLLKYRPKISIITPAWNTDEKWLRLAIESVQNQVYDNWELCIVNGGSTKKHVKKVINEYAGRDSRIRVKHLEENKGIAGNSNEALALATGEYVGFLDHDDELLPFTLLEVVKTLNDKPQQDFIYSDEDKIDERGRRMDPFFKPDWSPDMFLSCNYLCHFSVIRKKVLDKIGGFMPGYDGSQDYDLFLRATEIIDEARISHIPKILYHWRTIAESAASSCGAKPYAYIAAKKALTDSMGRRRVEINGVSDGFWTGSYRIRYAIEGSPKVSILIPNRDNASILKRCIDSIIKETNYTNYEIVVIDNQSHKDETLDYYEDLAKIDKVKMLYYDKPFNFSAINNYAVSKTDSDYIMFLNNDTEVLSNEWLSAMLEHAQREKVGAVGTKLLFMNGSIQHCGVVLGLGGVAGHPYSKFPDHNGYSGIINIIRNYSAVTAACMMTKRSCFEDVGGFNEVNLTTAFNDVDYCLKLREKGYLIVYTPYSQLYHHESLSRGREDTPEKQKRFQEEVNYMRRKWGGILDNDPFYSPNLTLTKEDFTIGI